MELALTHSTDPREVNLLQNWSALNTPNHTPKKGGQAGGSQASHPGGRKSQGPAAVGAFAIAAEPAPQTALEGELGLSKDLREGVGVLTSGAEEEPSLKDILLAINNCKASLFELSDQFKGIRNDFFSLRQEVQEVCGRTAVLEGRISQVEDDVLQMRQEVKRMRNQLDKCMYKMDEIENRLRRKNVRVFGLPERSEGNNPIEFMEGWFRDMFGRYGLSIKVLCN